MNFQEHYKGRFINMLRWPQLDQLWDKVKAQPNDWYIYFVGETVPTAPIDATELNQFIEEIDQKCDSITTLLFIQLEIQPP
ncbi:hypothetical protein THIOM_001482, partial [Candidatus Thiomargarita nelsonii]